MAKKDNIQSKTELIRQAIANYEKNDFTFYFFVVDSRDTPNGELAYIYQMAKSLHDIGYNVTMLYQMDKEYTESELYRLKKKGKDINPDRIFKGVGGWMGEEYMELPHLNIATQQWKVGPSDFLFIPEVFYSLMHETNKKHIPCRRIVVLHNYDLITDSIPYGAEWINFNIHDCVTHSEQQKNLLQGVFPYMKTKVLSPYIPQVFKESNTPKNLVVTVVAKDRHDLERVAKPFLWKNPLYKFVSFRYISGCSMEEMAKLLQESPITVWVDPHTSFGISALAAMRCGNVVIGKIPENAPEWMIKEDGTFKNNGFWVYNINDIPNILAAAVEEWMQNGTFEDNENLSEISETNSLYTYEQWMDNIKKYAADLIEEQTEAYKVTLTVCEKAEQQENEKQEQK